MNVILPAWQRIYYRVCGIVVMFLISHPCFALLPTPPDDASGHAARGDWLGFLLSKCTEALKFLIVILGGASAIAVIYSIIHHFLEAKKTHEWGGFAVTVIIGALALVLIGWLLKYAMDAIT